MAPSHHLLRGKVLHLLAGALLVMCFTPTAAKTVIRRKEWFRTGYRTPRLPPVCLSRTRCPIRRGSPVCGVYKGGSCSRFCSRLAPCRRAYWLKCIVRCFLVRKHTRRDVSAIIVVRGRLSMARLFRNRLTIKFPCRREWFSDGTTEGGCVGGYQSTVNYWLCKWLGTACAPQCTGTQKPRKFEWK